MNCLSGWSRFSAAFLCGAALMSCSDVERLEISDATLNGTVTYKGKPVPHALVIVSGGDQSSTAQAGGDGTYSVQHAPLGLVDIGVNTDAGRGMMMGQRMASQGNDSSKSAAPFVDLPKKFHNPATSGISTTVTDGANTFDIEIK